LSVAPADARSGETTPSPILDRRVVQPGRRHVASGRPDNCGQAREVHRAAGRHHERALASQRPSLTFGDNLNCDLIAHALDQDDGSRVAGVGSDSLDRQHGGVDTRVTGAQERANLGLDG
jgi:hypothetical protein